MSTVVNTDLYVRETQSPGVEHKIVRARLFAAVESTKGMTYPVVTLPSLPRSARGFRSVEQYVFPTPMHQPSLPLEVSR